MGSILAFGFGIVAVAVIAVIGARRFFGKDTSRFDVNE